MANQRKYMKFSEICVSVYVRQQLSEERVRFLADLYTSSASGSIPPIQVTQDNKLVDGRHRMAALKFLGEDGTVCDIVQCADSFEITIAALKANVGGSKELTMADIRQSIISLLNSGNSMKKITAQLPFPKELSRKLVKASHTIWMTQRTVLAAQAVNRRELTVEEASKKYSILQRVIQKNLTKMKERETDAVALSNMGSVKGSLTQKYYGLTTKMGNYMKKIAERYEQGEFTEAQVLEILAHVMHQARNHVGAMNDWNDRFSVMLKTRRPLIISPMPTKKLAVSDPSQQQVTT